MNEINNRWLSFLAQHGAQLSETEPRDILGFQEASLPVSENDSFICALPALGLTQASGEEAAHFLHSQLTNDVEHLGTEEARLAGYCSPKGRLLASLLMWRTGDDIFLKIPRDIQPAVQKRLQMFVLRAKVKLADVSDQFATLGLAGPAADAALGPWFANLPASAHAKTDADAGTLIRLPAADDKPRYLWIAPIDVAEQAWPELVKTLTPRAAGAWRLDDIRAGVPLITQAPRAKVTKSIEQLVAQLDQQTITDTKPGDDGKPRKRLFSFLGSGK